MSTAVVRWHLREIAGSDTYTFEINPNAQRSPYNSRGVRWKYHPLKGFSGTRDARLPFAWGFSGVLRSKEQYDALVLWANKRVKLVLTDDRGDQFVIRITEFKPTQEAGARLRHAPWRHTYEVSAFVYDEEIPA